MPRELAEPLLKWYEQYKRALPWRDQHNAYYTWVSEIMLQQTRVEAVKDYFLRFIKALPTIEALAECPEERLLKLWEGLGYYSRVRNMKAAAETVVERYGGVLPDSYEELCSLKGIGSYTAGAIASIAYAHPVPAVDGNVLRVAARITRNDGDITKQPVRRQIELAVKEIIPEEQAGEFNQALMELGAVICVPNGPAKCEECPISVYCRAYEDGVTDQYPKRAAKKARTIEEKTVLVIQDGDHTALHKRPSKGLLAGLYEIPNVPGHIDADEALKFVREHGLEPLFIEPLESAKHVFSHVEWRMTGYRIRVAALEDHKDPDLCFVLKNETKEQYAIPSAFRTYMRYMKEEKK